MMTLRSSWKSTRRSVWIPTTDPVAGLRDGKLDFELRGYKLRGLWHMVRTKRAAAKDPPEWLLMKKADGWARPPDFALDEGSIYSGLTLEEIAEGPGRAAETVRVLVVFDVAETSPGTTIHITGVEVR